MSSAATTPVVNRIIIHCPRRIIKDMWPDIQVTGSPVTIECVLEAIYDHFQQKITEQEERTIMEMDPERYRCLLNEARNERSGLMPHNEEDLVIPKVELRRVDCLGGRHSFGGLKVEEMPDGNYSVVLHLI